MIPHSLPVFLFLVIESNFLNLQTCHACEFGILNYLYPFANKRIAINFYYDKHFFGLKAHFFSTHTVLEFSLTYLAEVAQGRLSFLLVIYILKHISER